MNFVETRGHVVPKERRARRERQYPHVTESELAMGWPVVLAHESAEAIVNAARRDKSETKDDGGQLCSAIAPVTGG